MIIISNHCPSRVLPTPCPSKGVWGGAGGGGGGFHPTEPNPYIRPSNHAIWWTIMRLGRGDLLAWEEWRGGSNSWMGIGMSWKAWIPACSSKIVRKNEMLFKKDKKAKLAHEWDDPESVQAFCQQALHCLLRKMLLRKNFTVSLTT